MSYDFVPAEDFRKNRWLSALVVDKKMSTNSRQLKENVCHVNSIWNKNYSKEKTSRKRS